MRVLLSTVVLTADESHVVSTHCDSVLGDERVRAKTVRSHLT